MSKVLNNRRGEIRHIVRHLSVVAGTIFIFIFLTTVLGLETGLIAIQSQFGIFS